jgi:hypothetical protein
MDGPYCERPAEVVGESQGPYIACLKIEQGLVEALACASSGSTTEHGDNILQEESVNDQEFCMFRSYVPHTSEAPIFSSSWIDHCLEEIQHPSQRMDTLMRNMSKYRHGSVDDKMESAANEEDKPYACVALIENRAREVGSIRTTSMYSNIIPQLTLRAVGVHLWLTLSQTQMD